MTLMANEFILHVREHRKQLFAELASVDLFITEAKKRQRTHKTECDNRTAKTIAAAVEILRDRGALSTRDLLPLINGRGIEITGKSPVAVLCSRLSYPRENPLGLVNGKWHVMKRQGDDA